MEPMTLGSPVGSPAQAATANTSQFLPSYLMGEQQAPNTSRNNTLSPNKAGRNVSFGFATSPGPTSPQDFNRSQIGQKTLFGGYQDTPTTPKSGRKYKGTSPHKINVSGPPTQGLFDALRNERNQVQTPTRTLQLQQITGMTQSPFGTSTPPPKQHSNPYYMPPSYPHTPLQQPFNESYINNTNSLSFNTSARGTVSPLLSGTPQILNNSNMYTQQQSYSDFWVTVFGFPPNAIGTIMQHFAQCGTILDKVFPSQTGNWVHLKYGSRLECDKALNYNEKILSNNIMIGVTQCKDMSVIDKENLNEKNDTPTHNTTNTMAIKAKVRPLIQSAANENSVVPSPSAPQKVSGIMNKAMDLFFGW